MPNPEHIAALNASIEFAQSEYDMYSSFNNTDLKNLFTADLIANAVEEILESIERVKGISKAERKNPTDSANTLFNKVNERINNHNIEFLTSNNSRMLRAYWHLISIHGLETRNSSNTFAELMQAILDY